MRSFRTNKQGKRYQMNLKDGKQTSAKRGGRHRNQTDKCRHQVKK